MIDNQLSNRLIHIWMKMNFFLIFKFKKMSKPNKERVIQVSSKRVKLNFYN